MGRFNRIVILLLLASIPLIVGLAEAKAEVIIIVNHSNSVSSMKRSMISRLFLKKKTKWGNGEKVEPVDLTSSNAVREKFSEKILRKSVRNVESHWIAQTVTGGHFAPKIVDSADAVKRHVADNAGGIGYIDSNELDDSVKKITVGK